MLEISPNHLSVIETGGKLVTYKLLERMLPIFKIPPSFLFYSSDFPIQDFTQQKISNIIKTELTTAQQKIQEKIENLYRNQ